MKKQSHSKLIIRSSLVLALALVIWTPVQAQSTMPMKDKPMMEGKTAGQTSTAEPAKGMREGKMMERRQAMMERKQKMMAKMKKQDAALTAQVASMNRAPEDQKLDLLAAIVTQMVEQRTAMHARMSKMDQKMMPHTQMGRESMPPSSMKKGMKDMEGMEGMKNMKGMDEKSAGDHDSH